MNDFIYNGGLAENWTSRLKEFSPNIHADLKRLYPNEWREAQDLVPLAFEGSFPGADYIHSFPELKESLAKQSATEDSLNIDGLKHYQTEGFKREIYRSWVRENCIRG